MLTSCRVERLHQTTTFFNRTDTPNSLCTWPLRMPCRVRNDGFRPSEEWRQAGVMPGVMLFKTMVSKMDMTHLDGSCKELDACLPDFFIAAGDVCCHGKALNKTHDFCALIITANQTYGLL